MTEEQEKQLKAAVARGAQAAEEYRILEQAFSHIRSSLDSANVKTKSGPNGDEDRQEIHRTRLNLDRLEKTFKRFIRDGQMAEKTLTEKVREKFRRVS